MSEPLFSIVIPAWNQAGFLEETLHSVLSQTCPDFEIVVVDDASADESSEVVRSFDDPRIRLAVHTENRGLPAARNTGIRNSTGRYIALLDADDLFLPEKLASHLEYATSHPDVGATYNARFELNHDAATIRGIWRPPPDVGLLELVQGFPFAPSDLVIRRDWVVRVGMFGEEHRWGAEDLDFACRLALAGCRFASVDRILNRRRYHAGSRKRHLLLLKRLRDYDAAMEKIFTDPRCPPQVIAARGTARADKLLEVGYLALRFGVPDLGQKWLEEAHDLIPEFFEGQPSPFVNFLVHQSTLDENEDHGRLLAQLVGALPTRLADTRRSLHWAVSQGFLWRGIRAIVWNRNATGHELLSRAKEMDATIDQAFVAKLMDQLITLEYFLGRRKAEPVLRELESSLSSFTRFKSIRGGMAFDAAFRSFRAGEHRNVPPLLFSAIRNEPKLLFNRGCASLMMRSLGQSLVSRTRGKLRATG